MDGVLNVFKEKGCTSFDVVRVVRGVLHEKKVGHTGTLDPMAEGVLPVCLGKATKISGILTDTDKEYEAVIKLGISTDTQDITGNVLKSADITEFKKNISDIDIKKALNYFTGEIKQIPPMYSALKIGGVKLVDAARAGKEIERKPRKITIYGYENVKYLPDEGEISFTVGCSKGTYIRALAADIGGFLGVPACLKSLRRTMAAGLRLNTSHTLGKIKEAAQEGKIRELLINTDSFFTCYKEAFVTADALKRLKAGNEMHAEDIKENIFDTANRGEVFRIYTPDGCFAALYKMNSKKSAMKCFKMFCV